jgi:hypothetical protein
MNLIASIWTAAQGYRTYLASGAAILTALAGLVGILPSSTAQGLAVTFGALAAIALRLSQSNHALTLAEALQAIQDVKATLDATKGPPGAPPSAQAVRAPRPPGAPPSAQAVRAPRPTIPFSSAALLAILICGGSAIAQERPTVLTSMQLSPATRGWFRNPDGSCVQCSIGMCGVHCNDINAASLLWDTDYGPAVRGGSWPSRVEKYCDQRGIKAWSVTGATVDETIPWCVWAARTGRFAAIGAGQSHFQTLYGYDPNDQKPWMVCNNNSPQKIDRYSDRDFKQLHAASGPWVVILEKPSSDPPQFNPWWK